MSNINSVPNEGLERLSMRELLVRAREQLGHGAAALKTRQELEAALRQGPVAAGPAVAPPAPVVPSPAPSQPEIVVRDFFLRRR